MVLKKPSLLSPYPDSVGDVTEPPLTDLKLVMAALQNVHFSRLSVRLLRRQMAQHVCLHGSKTTPRLASGSQQLKQNKGERGLSAPEKVDVFGVLCSVTSWIGSRSCLRNWRRRREMSYETVLRWSNGTFSFSAPSSFSSLTSGDTEMVLERMARALDCESR